MCACDAINEARPWRSRRRRDKFGETGCDRVERSVTCRLEQLSQARSARTASLERARATISSTAFPRTRRENSMPDLPCFCISDKQAYASFQCLLHRPQFRPCSSRGPPSSPLLCLPTSLISLLRQCASSAFSRTSSVHVQPAVGAAPRPGAVRNWAGGRGRAKVGSAWHGCWWLWSCGRVDLDPTTPGTEALTATCRPLHPPPALGPHS